MTPALSTDSALSPAVVAAINQATTEVSDVLDKAAFALRRLRTTVTAFKLAAYAAEGSEKAALCVSDLIEAIEALLPLDDGDESALWDIKRAFREGLIEAASKDSNNAPPPPPQLLIDLMEVVSGASANRNKMRRLSNDLSTWLDHDLAHRSVIDAYYAALRRQGFEYVAVIRGSEATMGFQRCRPSRKGSSTATDRHMKRVA